MNIVIGTGMAGVSAAKALVEKGLPVTIIDAGLTLESDKGQMRDELAFCDKTEWPAKTVQSYTQGMKTKGTGVPQKLIYGSDYVYQNVHPAQGIRLLGSKVLRSFSLGGLSNVWGGCMLPYPGDELSEWPITMDDLAPFYAKVMGFVPLAAENDNLSERLPLYTKEFGRLNKNSQIQSFCDSLKQNRKKLQERGIKYGSARVAVNNAENRCCYCGLCLYGCPYGLIYSAAHTLQELVDEESVRYIPNVYVDRLEEKGNQVIVEGRDVNNGKRKIFTAERVFLGAGLVETTRMVLESLEAYNTPVTVRHSDRFVLPFFLNKGSRGVLEEELHTLSQVFIELDDRKNFARDVHLQVYGYNDLFKKALNKKMGPLAPLFTYPSRKFLEHLMVMFGYLHSDDSSHMQVTLEKDKAKRIIVKGVENPLARQACRRIQRTLFANRKLLGGIPIWSFLDLPGGGNHSGGSFPMKRSPGKLESDLYGVPQGFNKVHIVDSSTFPSLPAATIGLTIMANSYRIASDVVG